MITDTFKNILNAYLADERLNFEKQYAMDLLNLKHTCLPIHPWQAIKLIEDIDYGETHIIYDLLQLQLYYEKL